MPHKKSIFRQPGAQHFQLVHRSQRDPLIHDPDASQHVLKQVVRDNLKKSGKSRAQLEQLLDPSEIESRAGEAALYGIYYDDTEYDYMQHLRPIGVEEEGVESILIEAPTSSKRPRGITLKDLPPDVLPSVLELPRTYESQQEIPDSISGFQPDMDPHLRQVLEALDDDAFVDDDLDDDFFGDLVKDGERSAGGKVDFEFRDEGIESPDDEDEGDSWEQRFARYKRERQKLEPSSDDEGTEGKDTVTALPSITVIGGKKRRKGSSDASGYSMSSSSMYRNEALQTLDEQFDQMMLREYNDDDDDDDEEQDENLDVDEAPQLITSRADFASMMNEFLDEYEILGRKLKPKLAGDTGPEKLDTLRRAMGQDERIKADEHEDEDNNDLIDIIESREDRWDCETILSTYTNLENRPRVIGAREEVAKIHLDAKTGLPSVAKQRSAEIWNDNDMAAPARQTITRRRGESPESKKSRKATVKTERAIRRVEKRTTKELFANEYRKQTKLQAARDVERGMRKL